MAKDMSTKEKLLFILSFFWFMHWGVNIVSLLITKLAF